MVDYGMIRPHMPVIGSDGERVGAVDAVEGAEGAGRIKLTRNDSPDGQHHYVPLSSVARVDEHVHLSVPASAVRAGGATAGATAGTGVANPAVAGDAPRSKRYLPWVLLGLALLVALLLYKGCSNDREAIAVAPTQSAPSAATVAAGNPDAPAAGTLGVSGLSGYLAGTDPAPRSFAFEKINFDTGSSAIRPSDRDEIDQVAAVLKQYTTARVSIAGYADARGDDPANARLGQARAEAVKAALVGTGIDAARIETASGGEAAPADTNATTGGQAENRRTELVVTGR
ncbi:DUF2171 domain-containing protein [Sphingomonas sp.]|jgi:outer membrane protein OmpA-like peptidoglycan-associated protein|uniref:DUF2171 domain-containing protein n=1 Tax=Sphingomonas sp. TaxID=28214 RepID=UPI002D80B022|nr:DUF2171 domain-containing protein [Sphingomonas sp.]HEU0045274.1 DUF2171 domain-containing protein [Sphingomonas sp.]